MGNTCTWVAKIGQPCHLGLSFWNRLSSDVFRDHFAELYYFATSRHKPQSFVLTGDQSPTSSSSRHECLKRANLSANQFHHIKPSVHPSVNQSVKHSIKQWDNLQQSDNRQSATIRQHLSNLQFGNGTICRCIVAFHPLWGWCWCRDPRTPLARVVGSSNPVQATRRDASRRVAMWMPSLQYETPSRGFTDLHIFGTFWDHLSVVKNALKIRWFTIFYNEIWWWYDGMENQQWTRTTSTWYDVIVQRVQLNFESRRSVGNWPAGLLDTC